MKNKETFVHLHAHTEYSILDGVGRLKEMVKKVAKNNSKALSITDHGSVSGHISFQLACFKSGIKPIFGCEFYTCEDHLNKTNRTKNHLVLLAKNEIGYKNLIKLASIAAIDGKIS
jgi:DNA polymerase-3 subunit alpha